MSLLFVDHNLGAVDIQLLQFDRGFPQKTLDSLWMNRWFLVTSDLRTKRKKPPRLCLFQLTKVGLLENSC
jgi:hypothetical protein